VEKKFHQGENAEIISLRNLTSQSLSPILKLDRVPYTTFS